MLLKFHCELSALREVCGSPHFSRVVTCNRLWEDLHAALDTLSVFRNSADTPMLWLAGDIKLSLFLSQSCLHTLMKRLSIGQSKLLSM